MEITLDSSKQFPIVHLKGNFNSHNDSTNLIKIIEEEVLTNISKFVVDLSELQYMSSVGIGALITVLTKTRRENGDLILTNLNDHVKKLLVMTKISSIFEVEEDLDKALNTLKNSK
ncbi:MAG: anti-sigma B factor antagonist [Sphingobacteriales bacterium]|jgi:anti-sigma B factor antagonist